MDKVIYVYAGWIPDDPQVGIYRANREHRTVMFQYDGRWISDFGINIDPELSLTSGWQFLSHAGTDKTFGFISDASPDRWGRNLVRRKESHIARAEKRRARTLMAEDYLINISDLGRQGGLRFKENPEGPFMSPLDDIPKVTDIRTLEQSSRILEEAADPMEYEALRDIFDPGSSLGGARPKANVRDINGNIWIAKFQSKRDYIDTGAWEMVAHDLARKCGITVPEAQIMRIEGRSVFLSKRFDREKSMRKHMMSMMTALQETDSTSQDSGKGFLDMAEFISFSGAKVKEDLAELFRRTVYFVCISNTDCHFRNHALLLNDDGWRLSPAYDMNPNPERDTLAINITDSDCAIDLNLVREIHPFFQLSEQEAENIILQIKSTVKENWRKTADFYRISESEQRYMEPAFTESTR